MPQKNLSLKYEPFVKDVMTARLDDLLNSYNNFFDKLNNGFNNVKRMSI
jgi:hypothetical protein